VPMMVARRLWARRRGWQGVATAVEVWESLPSSVGQVVLRRVVLVAAEEEESMLVEEDMVALRCCWCWRV
jgi:hypothetical protein